jgi:hypothetical protein
MERLAILQLRAAQGWSAAQTAKRFLVQPATIASWMKRIDEGGKGALLQRLFRSLKEEWLRRIAVPLGRNPMRERVALYIAWHGEHRAHQGLYGRTPNEM